MRELRFGFEGELVPGDVGRVQADGLGEVVERLVGCLVGQAVHQVDVEAVEVGGLDGFGRDTRLRCGVDAAETGELRGVEGLSAEGDACHAGASVGREVAVFDGARIGFQRDLGGFGRVLNQRLERLGGKQAWRAAAEVDGLDGTIAEPLPLAGEIVEQDGEVGLVAQFALQRVRVEIAVRALGDAPREVDVEAERRRGHGPDRRVARRRQAWPRWERRFFSAARSSAAVLPSSGTRNRGS